MVREQTTYEPSQASTNLVFSLLLDCEEDNRNITLD